MSLDSEISVQDNLIINAQYTKDLSFENPQTPYSLLNNDTPNINIAIDVRADNIRDNIFEVVLNVSIKATTEIVIFVIDLSYGGLFTINDQASLNEKEIILLVNCANILFPYVRRIISDTTRDGGYPPLMLAPVDFMGLYYQKKKDTEEEKTND